MKALTVYSGLCHVCDPHTPRFLEDVIKRLSAELARRMGAAETDGPDPTNLSGAAALGSSWEAGGGGGGGSGVRLPPWMRDPGFMNPLLAAYDERVKGLEADAAARTAAARAIEGQVRGLCWGLVT